MPQKIVYGLALIGLHRSVSQGEVVYMNSLLILSLLRAACCDDETNEQHILRAPTIIISIHCQTKTVDLMLDADVRSGRDLDMRLWMHLAYRPTCISFTSYKLIIMDFIFSIWACIRTSSVHVG